MKSSKLSIRFGAGFVLGLVVLLSGCKDQNNSTTLTSATPAATTSDTNASVVNADNSGKNERDRHDMTLTPGDQGNSDADREITQKIRQTLVSSTNDYSMTARNVKIITTNGMVTLRGPVNSDAEKTGIGMAAQNIAGPNAVDNQLEVKSSQ